MWDPNDDTLAVKEGSLLRPILDVHVFFGAVSFAIGKLAGKTFRTRKREYICRAIQACEMAL